MTTFADLLPGDTVGLSRNGNRPFRITVQATGNDADVGRFITDAGAVSEVFYETDGFHVELISRRPTPRIDLP